MHKLLLHERKAIRLLAGSLISLSFSKWSPRCVGYILPLAEEACPALFCSSLQVCIMECEGKAFSSTTWELCTKVVGKSSIQVNADSLEEDSYQPSEMDDSGLFRGSRKHFNDLTKVVDEGKYSYRQVLEPTMQGVQKRYGGFIGVRKSARKWNNQKRFSEFLKQYLGMSPRSSEYDSLTNDLNEQNEI
uniref:Prepronociceptin n=1 Tax=Gopherus evgoodei TaxID=1825980 RepID=A0A8C4VX47_9SAUR